MLEHKLSTRRRLNHLPQSRNAVFILKFQFLCLPPFWVFCLHLWHRPMRNSTLCTPPLTLHPQSHCNSLLNGGRTFPLKRWSSWNLDQEITSLFKYDLDCPKEPECLRRVLRRARTRLNLAGSDIPKLTFNWGNKGKMVLRLNANCTWWHPFKISHEPGNLLLCLSVPHITAK